VPSGKEEAVVQQYAGALVLLLTVTAFVVLLYVVHLLVGVARDPLLCPSYIAGLTAPEFAVSRFHARWYAMTLVFLAFDVEMLFMYPWVLVVSAVGVKAVIEMFAFLGLLSLAVLYAWREGAFRWG